MRRRHRLVLVGGFNEDELRQLFRQRGIRLHSPLVENVVDGFQEGEICFNPKRIKPKTVIQVLTRNRTPNHNVALVAMETPKEECHDCQTMAA